jgi:hypothetical protein
MYKVKYLKYLTKYNQLKAGAVGVQNQNQNQNQNRLRPMDPPEDQELEPLDLGQPALGQPALGQPALGRLDLRQPANRQINRR